MITSQTGTDDVNTLDIRYTLNSDISHNMTDLNDKTIAAFSFPFDSVVSGFYLNDGELKIVYENQLIIPLYLIKWFCFETGKWCYWYK